MSNLSEIDRGELNSRLVAIGSLTQRHSCLFLAGAMIALVCLCGAVLNIPQSYIGQWLVAPPIYPSAEKAAWRLGGYFCKLAPAVYCAETIYWTPDAPAQVVGYYENLQDIRFQSPLHFEAESGKYPAHDQQSVRYCQRFIGYRSCVQLSIMAAAKNPIISADEGTALYILEFGGAQRLPDDFAEDNR